MESKVLPIAQTNPVYVIFRQVEQVTFKEKAHVIQYDFIQIRKKEKEEGKKGGCYH